MQSKKTSLLESMANVGIGGIVSFILQPVIFWISGVSATHAQGVLVVILFTILSIVRMYVVRRFFNI